MQTFINLGTLQHLDGDVYFLATSRAVTFHIHRVLPCIRSEHLVIISGLVKPGCGCDLSPLGMNGTDGPGA